MSIGATLGPPWARLGVSMLTDDELLAKSSGEIAKPETLNYRTLAPEPGGLFDTDVFADPDEGK